jgi:DnaJ-domain-containing protein 1
MIYLVIGGVAVIGFLVFARWFAAADVKQLAKGLKWFIGAAAAILGVYLILTGRWALLVPIVGAGAVWLARMRLAASLWRQFRNLGGSSGGRVSTIETRFLRMSLDHDSGAMTGTVRQGPHAGDIERLNLDDLRDLLMQCRTEDAQSAQILEAYLDRRHPDWRDGTTVGDDDAEAPKRSGMTREEACRILGIEPGATEEQVRDAHRRLMSKLHPDRGGSDYLASQINQAKDILLGS